MALAFLLMLAGCHQPAGPSLDRQLVGEVIMHSELAANLRALCLPGGRLSGSPGAHQAEQYVADEAREYGLANVHLEPFDMVTWRDRSTTVTVMDDPPFVIEGALALGGSLSTPPDGVTAELIDLGQGLEADFETHAAELAGKFVLVREDGPHRGAKMQWALRHGAAGLVQVSVLPDLVRVGTCHDQPAPQPGVAITGAHGQALADRLAAGETVRLNVRIEADAWPATPNNVVAEMPGTGSLAHQIVIVCAHLDSWHLAEGALDNGTGSAAILETARALTRVGWKPKRTVRFIWFMGEEHGLYGSRAYVRDHQHGMDDIVCVVNVDMPGSPRRFITFGHAEVIDFLRAVRGDLAAFEISDEIGNATWTGSDHTAFMRQGVCAVSLSGDLGPGVKFYHSTGDAYDQVDRRGTNLTAAALAVLVRRLADEPGRPTTRLDVADVESEEDWW